MPSHPDSFLQKWDNADALLYICRQLWGLSYIAPVYTLLLHQWLLLNKDAGGSAERQKHVSVVIQGMPPCPPTIQIPSAVMAHGSCKHTLLCRFGCRLTSSRLL